MALFTINIEAKEANSPDQVGDISFTLDYLEDHVFTTADFTTNTIPQYHHPQGYPATILQVITIPTTGVLQLNGAAVTAGLTIPFVDIASGLLIYVSADGTVTEYSESFTFTLADSTSNTFSADTGTVSITRLEKPNEPPSEVGDGEATIEYAEALMFTRAMFTTATTPPYADPEGDAALNLRVDSLPVDGTLKLNGVNVIVNQVISFADIDAGLFIYVSGTADTDGDIETFNFSIADAGSGQFTS